MAIMKYFFLFLSLLVTINSFAQQVTEVFWYQKPMRILQTVMRQTDAIDYNTDSLVNYMKAARSEERRGG